MVLIRYRTVNGEDEYEWYSVREGTVEDAIEVGDRKLLQDFYGDDFEFEDELKEGVFWYGEKAVLIDAITPITKQESEVLSKFYIVIV